MKIKWIEASAGSGKTTFLLKQIANYQTHEVMFLTFSNAASDEIKERIKQKYDMQIQSLTLHSLAYKILRKTYGKDFKITDSLKEQNWFFLLQNTDVNTLVDWLLKNDNINKDLSYVKEKNIVLHLEDPIFKIERFEKLFQKNIIDKEELLEYKKIFFTQKNELRKKIKLQELEGLNVLQQNEVIEQIINRILLHEDNLSNYILQIKNQIYNAFIHQEESLKYDNDFLYYNDLIKLALKEIKNNNNIVYDFFKNIKVLLIDEAQDLSKNQLELIFEIINIWSDYEKELFVASDSKQLIYEFQNASLDSFYNFKKQLKSTCNSFEEIQLNTTYRLSKNVCDFINKNCEKLSINFQQHFTQNQEKGNVFLLKLNNISQLITYIQNSSDYMVLFKEKIENTKKIAKLLMQNNYFINSPYIVAHPIIKDFQYLIKYLVYGCRFSLTIVYNALGKQNMHYDEIEKDEDFNKINNLKLYVFDLEILFYHWSNFDKLYCFLNENYNLNLYIEILRQYAKYYKFNINEAMDDENDFYSNNQKLFAQGVFFNTIHSSKGKEADNVFLINCETRSKHNIDTHRLLYVALTRAKVNLYIVQVKDVEENSWLDLLDFSNAVQIS